MMNKWMLILALCVSLNISAGPLRVDNVLINKGDSIDVLLMVLGAPKAKVKTAVCLDQQSRSASCRQWGSAETWFYRYEDLNWKIQILGDTIQDINWSRY